MAEVSLDNLVAGPRASTSKASLQDAEKMSATTSEGLRVLPPSEQSAKTSKPRKSKARGTLTLRKRGTGNGRGRGKDYEKQRGARDDSAEEDALLVTPITAHAYDPDADSGEEDDRLYCVCQKKYDPERIMIACDNCEGWFHAGCLGMQEDEIDLVSDLICPNCIKLTAKRTTWKLRCSRETCRKARLALSKYCSEWCGMQVVATRLQSSAIAPDRFWPTAQNAQRRRGVVLLADESNESQQRLPLFYSQTPPSQMKKRHSAALSPARLGNVTNGDKEGDKEWSIPIGDEEMEQDTLMAKLATLKATMEDLASKRTTVQSESEQVDTRLTFLSFAVKRWEASVVEHERKKLEAASSERSVTLSRARSSTVPNDAPCGFDVRLTWSDTDWHGWVKSEEGSTVLREQDVNMQEAMGNVCTITRKRCDRHHGWQRLIEASFEAEKAAQTHKVFKLDEQTALLTTQVDEVEATLNFLRDRNARRQKPAHMDIDVFA